MDEEHIAWLSLKLIPDLGNRSLLRLLRHFGSASAILRAHAHDLAVISGFGERGRLALTRKAMIRPPEAEWAMLQQQGIQLICLGDAQYPANLAAIPDPPVVLFVKGSLEPRDLVAIAIVGSRAASPMGMIFTERLSADLARAGVTIVSGFAAGIDGAAHRGALKAKGRTIAVLGCGLDVAYPRMHGGLRREIGEAGALLTEFPLSTPPAPGHFPMRNRIISGLSLGVVVVEAAQRSGSLITARLALEQGREVFAVPGMAQHYRSVGAHRLLKQGAKLVESAEDVLEEIRPAIRRRGNWEEEGRRVPVEPRVNAEEGLLLQALDQCPRHIDEICRTLRWPVSQVMAHLLALELKGRVGQLPGKYYVNKG